MLDENLDQKFYSNNYRCNDVGYFEYMKQNNANKKRQLFIVGSGYERKYLIELLKFLKNNLNDYRFIYKLRPEENLNEFKKLINFDTKNIFFLEKVSERLLKKKINESVYVIGTNSTLLAESINLSNVIIYKKGWYKDFDDLIKKRIVFSANNCKEVVEIIKKKRTIKKFNKNLLFKKPNTNLLKKLLGT